LLAEKKWKLKDYGNDSNKHGVLDLPESMIEACEKDNEIKFDTNIYGKAFENAQVCEDGEAETVFGWKLIDINTLDFNYTVAAIIKLNTESLIIAPAAGARPVQFIFMYVH
jgi:hypothetical protein